MLDERVGKHTAHAIFAKALGLDAHITQNLPDGRIHTTVAFQFYDSHLGELIGVIGLVVVKPHSQVDGQSLGAGTIDKRDTAKPVLERQLYIAKGIPCMLAQKFVNKRQVKIVGVGDFDTLFLCSPLVVLVFHLQKREVRAYVGAHPDFFPHFLAREVNEIHLPSGSVVIAGVV